MCTMEHLCEMWRTATQGASCDGKQECEDSFLWPRHSGATLQLHRRGESTHQSRPSTLFHIWMWIENTLRPKSATLKFQAVCYPFSEEQWNDFGLIKQLTAVAQSDMHRHTHASHIRTQLTHINTLKKTKTQNHHSLLFCNAAEQWTCSIHF